MSTYDTPKKPSDLEQPSPTHTTVLDEWVAWLIKHGAKVLKPKLYEVLRFKDANNTHILYYHNRRRGGLTFKSDTDMWDAWNGFVGKTEWRPATKKEPKPKKEIQRENRTRRASIKKEVVATKELVMAESKLKKAQNTETELKKQLQRNANLSNQVIKTRRMQMKKFVHGLVQRDGNKCWFCSGPFKKDNSDRSVEHLIAVKDGGPNDQVNLVLSHKECNSKAGHMVINDKLLLKMNLTEQYKKAAKKRRAWKPKRSKPKNGTKERPQGSLLDDV